MKRNQNTAATNSERLVRPVAGAACGNADRGANGRSQRNAALRAGRAVGLAFALTLSAVALASGPVRAAGLECPEEGPNKIPDLLAGARQIDRMTNGNLVDLGNEIRGLINKVQTEKPGISNDEIVDVLLAAYCPVVARMSQISYVQKWRLMHQFDTVLNREVTAANMPAGSLIIANVPLPPPVFQSLTNKAEAKDQTPAEFMATVLTEAAKR